MTLRDEIRQILELQSELLKQLSKLIDKLDEEVERNERLLSIKRAAELLDLGESTLRRLVAQGKIKSVRVGGKILIPSSEVQRLIQSS